jgi:hypothetical protein
LAHSKVVRTALIVAAGVASSLTTSGPSMMEGDEENLQVAQEWAVWAVAWWASKPCSLGYTRILLFILLY